MSGTDEKKTRQNRPKRETVLTVVLTFAMSIAERGRPHVTETDGSLTAAVHKDITLMWVALGRRYHLRQLLHIGWLYIYNV